MPRRAIGIAGVVAGLAVMIAAVVHGARRHRPDRVSDACSWSRCSAITLAAARGAMLHDLHQIDIHVRAGGPPRHPVLLCNPWSGGGKVERFGLVALGGRTRRRDGDARPRARSRAARARRGRARGRLPRHGRRGRIPGAGRVDRRRARAAVRLRERRDAQPLRARSRAQPRRPPRVDVRVSRRRRAQGRLRHRERSVLRQQRVARRVRQDRAGGVVPGREGRDHEVAPARDARTPGRAVRPPVHDADRRRGRRRHSRDGVEQPLRDRRVSRQRAASPSRSRRARRLRGHHEHRRRRPHASSPPTAVGQRSRSAFWKEFTATEFEVRSRSGTAFAGVDGEALELPTPLRFRIHPRGPHPARARAATSRRPRNAGRATCGSATSSRSPPAANHIVSAEINLADLPGVPCVADAVA